MATSKIKGGVTIFELTPSSRITNGQGKGSYNALTGEVELWFCFSSTTNISSSTPVFTVPTGYRPQFSADGAGIVTTDTGATISANYKVYGDGTVSQASTGYGRSGFGVIKYTI